MPDRPPPKKTAAKKATHQGRVTTSSTEELRVTSANEWKMAQPTNQEGFVTELPSGNVVRMTRTFDLPILLSSGKIPNPLAAIVVEMMETRQESFPQTEDETVLKQLMDLLNSCFCNAVLEPRFSMPDVQTSEETDEDYYARLEDWQPDPGTVSIYNVLLQDKMYVYAVAQGAAADLARFRAEQAKSVFASPTGTDMGNQTVSTGGGV